MIFFDFGSPGDDFREVLVARGVVLEMCLVPGCPWRKFEIPGEN